MATSGISKIIHQSWKNHEIPHAVYRRQWIDSWLQVHSGWERRFWTDDDNDALVRSDYPEFYNFYSSLSPPIKKADFVRFLYMHRFGGIYVDLDFVSLRNLTPLLNDSDIVLGRLSNDNDYYQIPNAFMASCPGHEFWLKVASDAAEAPPDEQSVEMLAGPFRLQWAFERYRPERSVVYGDGVIYPFDWIHFTGWKNGRYFRTDQKQLAMELQEKSPAEMALSLPGSYCVTFWTHNW